MTATTTYLERYLAGQYEQVWAELQAMGERVREEPLTSDAMAVARETMLRVRRNIEMLIPRLEAVGYIFYADDPAARSEAASPHLATPYAETRAQLDEIERDFGPLPISLHAFYEVVGAVNLVGQPPVPEGEDTAGLDRIEGDEQMGGWYSATRLDPLYIYGLQTNYENWEKVRDDEAQRAEYRLLLFPDFLLKYGIGGVGPISIQAPAASMDAPLIFEGDAMIAPDDGTFLFVPYLRFALRRGGFPGTGMPSYDMPPISDAIRAQLVEGMLPF